MFCIVMVILSVTVLHFKSVSWENILLSWQLQPCFVCCIVQLIEIAKIGCSKQKQSHYACWCWSVSLPFFASHYPKSFPPFLLLQKRRSFLKMSLLVKIFFRGISISFKTWRPFSIRRCQRLKASRSTFAFEFFSLNSLKEIYLGQHTLFLIWNWIFYFDY